VSGQHGDFVLVHKPDPRPEWNPALYELTPADQCDVHGKYVTERTVRQGIVMTNITNTQTTGEFEGNNTF
jgi:hypothetical protein